MQDILQTKERMIRKQFHSKSSTEIGLIPDVRAFSRSNQRSEFPNKFKIKVTELDNLEHVVAQHTAPKNGLPQSSKVRLMSQALRTEGNRAATPQPFYYSNRNEILGFNDFFKLHTALEYRKKISDKLHFEQQSEERRNKLKELRVMSAHSRSRSRLSRSQTSLIISNSPKRPTVGTPNTRPRSAVKTPSSSGYDGTSAAALKALLAKDRSMTETGSRTTNDDTLQRISTGSKLEKSSTLPNEVCDPLPINVETNYLVSQEVLDTSPQLRDTPNTKEQSQDPGLISIPLESMLSQIEIPTHSEPGIYRFTEPKLTRKHVDKHLMNYTVTPKKMKRDATTIEFEKYYTRVYKDAKVMDKEVETNLQRLKTRAQLRNIGTLGVPGLTESPIRLRNVSRSRDRVIRGSHEKMGKFINTSHSIYLSNVTTTKEQDQEKHAAIAEKISQSIEEINEVLTDNLTIQKSKDETEKRRVPKRPLSNEAGKNLLKQLLANRVPSRRVIAEKYHIPTLVERNKELKERALQIKSVIQKQAEEEKTLVSYSTAEHVSYYIS